MKAGDSEVVTVEGTVSSALILHGLVHRSLRHTVDSLRECVIAPLERLGPVEVFFHSWEVTALINPRAGEAGEGLDSAEVARCLPEARGLFESQEAFDASVDWERLLRNNPMRHCCGNEDEARVTLMNLRRALESQERGGFTFHEVLFASVARRDGMKLLDWRADPDCGACFSSFVFRPEVSQVERGISHPVKDVILHEAICAIVPSGFPRMKRAKLDGWSILADDYRFLVKFCRAHGVRTVAEFGPGDSTLALLDAGCRVLSHEHDIHWLRMATERFENEPDVEVVHCPEGLVPEWNGLETDLVFVDGPPYREGQAMSRIGPCEWALEHCGCFLLHDAKRHGERATLEEMERRGLHVAPIPTTKGMALVVDPVKKRRLAFSIETWRRTIDESPGSGWRADDWIAWSVLLREDARPMRILHCGAADGGLSGLLLERIFTHRESEVHAIDCYDGEEGGRMREAFEKRALAGGNADRIHLHEGTAREALAWMIAEENYWEGFDVAIMNPREQAPELLADACQAWSLLRPGAVLVFPEQGQGSEAAEAFLRVFAARLEMWLDSGRAVVRKRW